MLLAGPGNTADQAPAVQEEQAASSQAVDNRGLELGRDGVVMPAASYLQPKFSNTLMSSEHTNFERN